MFIVIILMLREYYIFKQTMYYVAIVVDGRHTEEVK